MKKTALLVGVISLATGLYSGSALAVEGLSANAAVTNNYIWRGLTQTDNQAGVSGGVDYNAKSGFYAGVWASNVKYASANSELDLYAGYGFEVSEFVFDVGYLNYSYPAGEDLDFSEVYASVNWQFLTVGYNLLANSDAGGDFGDDDYLFADLSLDIDDGLALGFHIGSSSFDAGGDYTDYGVSLSKNGFTFALTNTDQDGDDMNVAISYAMDFDL